MQTSVPKKLGPAQMATHYVLVAVTTIAWLTATSGHPTQQWILHRGFGLTATVLVLLSWIKALEAENVLSGFGSLGQALTDLRTMTLTKNLRPQGSAFVMPMVITYGLTLSTIVVLTGLPSIVNIDAVGAPATWVIWSRQIHMFAGGGLMMVWIVNAYNLLLTSGTKDKAVRRGNKPTISKRITSFNR